ncbi:FAD-binding oxidoreductase [Streptomyces swartbergensis]|uniref:FAD-linked oxidase n=1 Tax=Streptomyces swartbergensis TaxID=487165 RepID=A0A243R6D3_9ACTN|nr:FAD-binding oxidoreductase [Streptomyces swartbergensis]OUC90124.1 FAD-linked oxidase [Streptomyces swartbergensis]
MLPLEVTTRTGERAVLKESVARGLAESLRGELLLPGDDRYDQTRRVWNGMIDHRPALIARCAGSADVAAAVAFAREHDLLVSVRGGGHNIAGKAVCVGGLMIDLSLMRRVAVDADNRTARVEGGATLGEMDSATQVSGLATTTGVVTHTGVAGLTLGGGVGRLARTYGLACDNLLSVDVVTTEGDLRRASAAENPDLFWGMRGAGANFGVATSLEFKLHPVGPEVLGGVVVHPLARAREALGFYCEYSRSAPNELTADAFFLTSPDGDPVFAISVFYAGSMEQGERVLEPLRRFGPPIADQVGPVAYTQLQAAGDPFFPVGLHYYWKSHFLEEIPEDAIEATVEHFAIAPSPRSLIVFQQYGGAVSRIPSTETAFHHRNARYDNFAASVWTDPQEHQVHKEWARQWWDKMSRFSLGAEYVNNLGEEGEDRVRAAYGDNYDRLVGLKNEYDPDNFFRLNANILPSG